MQTSTAGAALEREHALIRSLWEPPPDLTVSQWADRFRVLSKGTTSRPGPWRAEAFQLGIMDEFNNPETRVIVVQKSTQIGWSEILNNIIGYVIAVDPKPMIMVRPTAEDARDWGRQRIEPMIRDCAPLRARVREAKEKRGNNTLRLKTFPGGHLKLVGANAGSGLRSDPISVVLLDEVDGYPADVNKEGDPVEIVKRRTDTFPDAKILLGSTPAKPKGESRVEKEFLKSDQRYFHVPCPHCQLMQPLEWRDPVSKEYRLKFDRLKDGTVDRDSVAYECAGCAKKIPEHFKQQMLDAGRWVAKFPGRTTAGFFINALYSPWKDNWADMAQEWIDSKDDVEKLRSFVNLRLGETWEEQGEAVDADSLLKRRVKYESEVPAGVGALIMSVDVQNNRLEAAVYGFGEGEESWLIKHEVFYGDPGSPDEETVWTELEALRLTALTCAAGRKASVDVTVVDTGFHTDAVYDYVKPRQNNNDRVFAIKGVKYLSKPGLIKESPIKKKSIRLFTVAADAAKERIYSRLKSQKPGSGYVHLPEWVTEEFLAQLTGEKKIGVVDRRTHLKKYYWKKTHTNNEALDLTVYALAGLHVLQGPLHRARDLEARAAEMASPPPGTTPPKKTPQGGTGGGWVTGGGGGDGGWVGNY